MSLKVPPPREHVEPVPREPDAVPRVLFVIMRHKREQEPAGDGESAGDTERPRGEARGLSERNLGVCIQRESILSLLYP